MRKGSRVRRGRWDRKESVGFVGRRGSGNVTEKRVRKRTKEGNGESKLSSHSGGTAI